MNNINTYTNKTKITISLLLYFMLFVLTITLYSRTISYDVSGIDDDIFLEYSFKDYSIKDIFTRNVFLDKSKAVYRPILALSFFIDNLIYHSPSTMHITNILLHVICAILFMFFLRYYFDIKISFLVSLLFAAHPLCVFTAVWIPGRNDSLLCMFFLLSIIFFIEYLRKDKKIFLFLNIIFFVFSLLTKESSIIFPVVYICLWLICNKLINKRFVIITSIYFFILCSFLIGYTIFFLSGFKVVKAFPYWINNFIEIFDYFAAIFFFNVHISAYFYNTIIILGVVSIILYFCFSYFSDLTKKEKTLFFFLPIVLIGINLVVGKVFFQGNRAYLALLFVLIPFCSFITKYFNKKIVYAILIILVLFSANITMIKQKSFKNDTTFFGAIDKEKENYNIYLAIDYSCFLLRDGYWQKASVKAKEIEKILKKDNEENISNLYVLAIVCMYEEDFKQAINLFEKIISSFDQYNFSALQLIFKINIENIYTKLILSCEKLNNIERKDYYYNILLNICDKDTRVVDVLIEKEREAFILNK